MTCRNKEESALIVNEMATLFVSRQGGTKRKEVAEKLVRLEEQQGRVQRDLDLAEQRSSAESEAARKSRMHGKTPVMRLPQMGSNEPAPNSGRDSAVNSTISLDRRLHEDVLNSVSVEKCDWGAPEGHAFSISTLCEHYHPTLPNSQTPRRHLHLRLESRKPPARL